MGCYLSRKGNNPILVSQRDLDIGFFGIKCPLFDPIDIQGHLRRPQTLPSHNSSGGTWGKPTPLEVEVKIPWGFFFNTGCQGRRCSSYWEMFYKHPSLFWGIPKYWGK